MKTFLSTEGEILYKKIVATIELPGGKKTVGKALVAPPGKGITSAEVERWLEAMVNAVSAQFPNHEYSLVAFGPTTFKFVWRRGPEVPRVELAS